MKISIKREQNNARISSAERENVRTKFKTMKKFLSMAALALVGAVMTGCSGDDDSIADIPQQPENKSKIVTLTTTVGLDAGATTRALTGGGVKTFAEGEQMAVVYNNGTSAVKAVSRALEAGDITDEGKTASFTFDLETPNTSVDVTYIYPAAMAKADGSVNYDALASQDGTLASLASNLDLATKTAAWEGTSLPSCQLENQLAILAVTLKDNIVSPVEITSGITGMTISDGTYNYSVSRSAAAGPIYVAIRPTDAADIEITATNGSVRFTKSLTGKTYAQGQGYNVSWKMNPVGAIRGRFSVSSTKQVYISQGNLQATYNGFAWSWAFATNQWDYIGNAVANTKVKNSSPWIDGTGTVDLFGWSTDHTRNYFGIHQSGYYTGNFNDWGSLAITNGGKATNAGWRTLTKDEWYYLLDSRLSGSTLNGKNNARYTKATVNGVKGLIIFPDNVTIANSEASWGTNTIDYPFSDYTTTCTADQWTALEAKGCVFLPAAGYRNGTNVINPGNWGVYWSSTSANNSQAYYMSFSSGTISSDPYNRPYGCSVRLAIVAP